MLRMWVVVLLGVPGLSWALVCPDGGMCEDRNTCCKNMEGGYGCCPLPHAECCSDHLHCCYEGTVCDLVHSKCVNKTVSLPMMRRVPTTHTISQFGGEVSAVMCPDQESECPDETTCCQLVDGSWGCCPLVRAVCCEDKLHCCPEGTKCDVAHSKCVSGSLQLFPMLRKIPAARRRETSPAVGSVKCPGERSSCPDSYTCCLLTSGDYGCCPYPQATCCSDHLHCCPSNSVCDLDRGVCSSGEKTLPMLLKISAVSADVVCPDQTSSCPDQTTCCQLTDGSYGCCPMPDAVCCSDHIHCCPSGTQCDLVHSRCLSSPTETNAVAMETTPTTVMMQLQVVRSKGAAVPCNSSVACADGSTCCKTSSGQWACCPLPKAVCCEDFLHCCPEGTTCNLEASTCDDPAGGALMPWISKVPVIPLEPDNSKCDKTTTCPGKSTCCKTPTGDWACCPLPQAVCCEDHVHCCPHATVCNLEAETCDDPSGLAPSRPMVLKVPALVQVQTQDPVSVGSDEKCDKQTMCPGGTTCCRKDSGQWACCPLPQAVCCSDGEHCCPKGYQCNVAAQTCDKPGSLSLPWLHKIPALPRMQVLNQVLVSGLVGSGSGSRSRSRSRNRNMCDARTSCPEDTTCCFMEQRRTWGCCPLPQATCCKDGDHCCPDGHTCEPHLSSCSRGVHVVPWFTKLSARTEPVPDAVGDVKCDDKSSCATGTTCCKLQTGEWGCCPLVKAVCCEDHEHCCPQGYTCNMQTGTCEKKNHDLLLLLRVLPQTEVVRPEPAADTREEEEEEEEKEEERVEPCGATGEFHCSERETCCRVSETEWSCCPSPRAVCCSDSRHCCPAGSSCDLQSGGCSLSGKLSWDFLIGDRKKHVGL